MRSGEQRQIKNKHVRCLVCQRVINAMEKSKQKEVGRVQGEWSRRSPRRFHMSRVGGSHEECRGRAFYAEEMASAKAL